MSWVGRLSVFRFFAICFLLFCIYGVHVAWNQRAFENYLNSVSITFDAFPPDYSQALIDAHADGRPVQYDNYSSFPALEPNATISPLIHFIWFRDLYNTHLDVSKIPATGSGSPQNCENNNPNLTVKVWNATAARSLIAEHYAWFLPTYDGYHHPIQRVDAFKYFVIWHFGGIYMDMDMNCRRSLYPLLHFPAWFPKTSLLGVNNDAFAARAGHPMIGEMTRRLQGRDWNLLFPYLTIYWSTGPQFASDIVYSWFRSRQDKPLPPPTNGRQHDADPDSFYVLPEDFYSETYSFFGHSPGGTWHGWDVAIALFLVAHPWVPAIVIGSLFSSCLIFWMRRRIRGGSRGLYTRAGLA